MIWGERESTAVSAARKLIGYTEGFYDPGYIHLTREEAKAIVRTIAKARSG